MVRLTQLFIAYLPGATDINPLLLFEYCPHCRTTGFSGKGSSFDKEGCICSCDIRTIAALYSEEIFDWSNI